MPQLCGPHPRHAAWAAPPARGLGRTPGTRLGPYEIISLIGVGGMGEVYRARDGRLGRDVAIKVLAASRIGNHEAELRFEREARAAASLNHPGICALFDVGQSSACVTGARGGQTTFTCLVMELLEGETLYSRLQRGPIAT